MPSFYRQSGSIKTCAAIHPVDGSQTANHDNSTSPTGATLSNSEAGYATLGGRYKFAAVAPATTDYALFAFQVPAGYRLMITGVRISTTVTGVAVVTATVLDWSLGLRSPAVPLDTAGLIRMPMGVQGFLALAGIGSHGPDIERTFDPELVVEHGEYFHVILQVPAGAATANLVFRGDVTITGYFESVS